jgi:hypothetical protein
MFDKPIFYPNIIVWEKSLCHEQIKYKNRIPLVERILKEVIPQNKDLTLVRLNILSN